MAEDARQAMIDGLLVDGAGAPSLTSREQALVRYADVVTLRPSTVRRSDIDALRAQGLDDLAIHDACAIVAYFAFVNRIADGLGVELERDGDQPGTTRGASG